MSQQEMFSGEQDQRPLESEIQAQPYYCSSFCSSLSRVLVSSWVSPSWRLPSYQSLLRFWPCSQSLRCPSSACSASDHGAFVDTLSVAGMGASSDGERE